MTKLQIFNKLMDKAKSNGYTGDDYKNQLGFILDGTNVYSVIFREDFAKAIWGDEKVRPDSINWIPNWKWKIKNLVDETDRWKYLEENVNFNN